MACGLFRHVLFFVLLVFVFLLLLLCFLTICIFRRLRIGCFRPCVLPVGKNETQNVYLASIQEDIEILTNQPAENAAGNAVCRRPVFRILASVGRNINVCREGH